MREVVPVWGAYTAVISSAFGSVGRYDADPIFYWLNWVYLALGILGSAIALGYSAWVIASARGVHRHMVWMFPGLNSTPKATVYYGLGFVIPVSVAIGVAAATLLTSPWLFPWFLVSFLGLAVGAACWLKARAESNLAVKETITSGQAPVFTISAGRPRWWWDGASWVGLWDRAPSNALLSPDGHYWWTGTNWSAMPPFPKTHLTAGAV